MMPYGRLMHQLIYLFSTCLPVFKPVCLLAS
jgi:hypothetical protein